MCGFLELKLRATRNYPHMADLNNWQIVSIALIFVWSGFVRSGLGFGGAVLALPFLLMVDNRPLVYLPIISVHLLFFCHAHRMAE